ncbi:hypothetical protein [Paenibacillus cremeus]|uniref:Uncharacterized protein n=1 Tax=Paenibacillus cremeus TaxID=2163881 RepID=A0A559KCG5_9BACL|nr:hypothetical protein [Paenibacillus cremeus]TVY09818.1 hypothetical protein FPZ49_10610 [Paenibacillus cremeus]
MDRFDTRGDSQQQPIKAHCAACGQGIYELELVYKCQDEICHKECLPTLVDAELFTAGEEDEK